MLIEFLGQQATPSEEEVALFTAALKAENRRVGLQAMIDSPGWFQRLKNTEIANAMVDEDEAIIASDVLARAAIFAPIDVLDLIERHWLPRKEFDGYVWHILPEFRDWDERHLAVAKEVLARTDVGPFAFDHLVSTLGASQPRLAIQLVNARLHSKLLAAKSEAESRETSTKNSRNEQDLVAYYDRLPRQTYTQMVESSDGWDGLELLAKADSNCFLEILWPWLSALFSALRDYETLERDRGFSLSQVVDLRFENEGTLGLPEYAILGAYRTALESLAAQPGDLFIDWLAKHEDEDAEPAQRLFAHALSSQPERYAPRALAFLLDDGRRFHLGNIEDYSETTKRLVSAVSPFWNDEELTSFIEGVAAYSPPPGAWRSAKLRQYFRRDLDRLKLELLEQIPQDRLPAETLAFVNRERRRFGAERRGATFTGPTWIGSPMSSEAVGLATDEDVVNAFNRLPDETGWDNPKTWMKGGNVQLSRAFADFSKTNPQRATEIISKLSPEIGTRAAGYALNAMAEEAEPGLVLDTIIKLEERGFSGEEYRGSAAGAIERLIRRDVTIEDKILDVLVGWLVDTPTSMDAVEPDSDDENILADVLPTEDDKDERVGSVLWGMGGMSILPHGNFPILEVITRILLQRRDHVRLINLLIDHLDRRESIKVWGAMLRFFRYINPDDKTLFVYFLYKLFGKFPELSATTEAAIALAHLHWTVPDFVEKCLTRGRIRRHQRYNRRLVNLPR